MNASERIREFVITNFLFGDTGTGLTDDTALLDSGVIDSTGIIELVLFISDEFGFEVPPEDMLPENFNTIASLSSYVQQRTAIEATS